MEPTSGSHFSHSEEQEQAKFILDGAGTESAVETGQPLPDSYGDNRLVIMARDPLWIFAYWDFTVDRVHALRDQVGHETWQHGQAVLRAYDVTDLNGDVSRANHFFDVSINLDTRSWYINVPRPGRSYIVELGFRFPDGRFFALLRSNRIGLPAGTISDQTDSRWMIVNVEEWEKMFETSGQFSRGSGEIAKMMAQRWEFLRSVFSGSSSHLSGSAPLVPAGPPDKERTS